MGSTKLDSSQISVATGENLEQHLEQVDATLDEATNRIVIFVIPGILRQGPHKLEMRFPFSGIIQDVYASCGVVSSEQTVISVEKNTQAIIDSDDPDSGWQSIFSTNLTIDGNKKTSNVSEAPYVLSEVNVNKDDHLRLNMISLGTGARDLTVEVRIKI